MSVMSGSSDGQMAEHAKMSPATVQPIDGGRFAIDTNAVIAFRVAFSTTISLATKTSAILASSGAEVGDVLLFTSGSLSGQRAVITEALGTSVVFGQRLSSAASIGDGVTIYRPTLLSADSNGRLLVKNTEYGTAGLPNFYWNILGLFEVPTAVIGDPISGTPLYVDTVSSTGVIGIQGTTAHGSADAGKPVKVGGKASTSTPIGVANGSRVDAYFDDTGHQHVKVDALPPEATTAASVSSATTLFQLSIAGERCISIHFTGTWTATVTFQVSNDGTNWIAYPLENLGSPTTARSSTASATNTMWTGPVPTSFFRAQVTAYTSGTISCRYCLMELPPNINSVQLAGTPTISGTVTASNTTGNVAHDGADSGNPVKVGTKSRTAHVTAVANNDRSDWTSNVLGYGGVTLFHQTQSTTFTTAAPTYGATLGDGFQWWNGGSLLVVATGAVTSWTVELQVSLNNANWTTILTHTNLAPTNGVIQFPVDAIDRRFTYARVGCTALVLGAGTNVIATVLLTQ